MPTKAALGTVKSPTIVDEMKEYTYFVSHLFWFPGTNLKTCIGKVKKLSCRLNGYGINIDGLGIDYSTVCLHINSKYIIRSDSLVISTITTYIEE